MAGMLPGTGGEEILGWADRGDDSDIFVAPSWSPVVHEVAEEAVLFSCSDRAVQEKLGLWRERRGNARRQKTGNCGYCNTGNGPRRAASSIS